MSSPDSNTVVMYIFLILASLFFLTAIYVHVKDFLPFSDKELENPESYFKGFMILSSVCTVVSIVFAVKKKDTVKTKDILQIITGCCIILAGLIISRQSEANLFVLGLTTLGGLLTAVSLDTQ